MLGRLLADEGEDRGVSMLSEYICQSISIGRPAGERPTQPITLRRSWANQTRWTGVRPRQAQVRRQFG